MVLQAAVEREGRGSGWLVARGQGLVPHSGRRRSDVRLPSPWSAGWFFWDVCHPFVGGARRRWWNDLATAALHVQLHVQS